MDAVPLSAEDRAILRLESTTVVGHTCKVIQVAGPAPDVAALRALIARRLGSTPALTTRLADLPDGPAWVPDEDFDLARHVVASAGEGPVDRAGLSREVARLFTERLDRARPLWRIDVIPRSGGGAALVWRLHHALADGTTMIRYARALLWDPQPSGASGSAGGRRAALPHPVDDGRRRHLAGFLHREFALGPDRSPFDGRIGTRRAVAFAAAPLGALHRVANALDGATLNDAVLSIVVGGLRRWLVRRHGHLGAVRVKVPVSLHRPGDDAGNHDSFFTVALPLGEPDPVARLRATHAATAACKDGHDAETMEALLRRLDRVSPSLQRWCERLEQSPRSFAVNVSNVPGPRAPVSVLDAPVEALYSLAEIGERHALRVAVISLADTLYLGICADPELVDDVADLAAGIELEARKLADAG
jgi:hypothetical protein